MPRFGLKKYTVALVVFLVSLSCRQAIQPLSIPTIVYNKVTPTATPQVILKPTLEATPVATSEATPGTTALVIPANSGGAYSPMEKQHDESGIASPTPDVPRELPEIRNEEEIYIVQWGDSLKMIAARYGVTVEMLVAANDLYYPDYLAVGQVLIIPAPIPDEPGSGLKIIPDSELVYGPYAFDFDINDFVNKYDSYLSRYSEVVDGYLRTGPEIVEMIAHDYSINPRLLLAILEYQSGWVTKANPDEETRLFPLGEYEGWRAGLYLQLAWAADNLNRGFYIWQVDGTGGWLLNNGSIIPPDSSINAGTAAVQQLFALLYDRPGWDRATSTDGLLATYRKLFGYPFDYSFEPLVPEDLEQPPLQLPFEPGVYWAFTGGPHGGWGEGSAWAALDFAPGMNGRGCVESDYWVVAAADGLIVRADEGRVIQDLDGDGNEGTGWTVFYMHIEGRDRVQPGKFVKAGERLGHPSCEGGYSTGTHFHLARRYNGVWISADRTQPGYGIPFNLEGWVSSGDGIEYNGYLERDGEAVTAYEGFYPANTIYR